MNASNVWNTVKTIAGVRNRPIYVAYRRIKQALLVAMYFLIALLGTTVSINGAWTETLLLPSTSSNGINSSVLQEGVTYRVDVEGMFCWATGNPVYADAAYAFGPCYDGHVSYWVSAVEWGEKEHFKLLIDGAPYHWLWILYGTDFYYQAFNPRHKYTFYLSGADRPVNFKIHDDSYEDNTGNLKVTISSELLQPDAAQNQAPEVVCPLPDLWCTSGSSFRYQFYRDLFFDADGYILSFAVSDLPPGVSFDAVTIYGTPTTPGVYPVTITASDNGNPSLSVSATFNLTVYPSNIMSFMVPLSDIFSIQSGYLQPGVNYQVDVEGILWLYLINDYADVEWMHGPVWQSGIPHAGSKRCSLLINQVAHHWLGTTNGIDYCPDTYSPTHKYRLHLTGMGQKIRLSASAFPTPGNPKNPYDPYDKHAPVGLLKVTLTPEEGPPAPNQPPVVNAPIADVHFCKRHAKHLLTSQG